MIWDKVAKTSGFCIVVQPQLSEHQLFLIPFSPPKSESHPLTSTEVH